MASADLSSPRGRTRYPDALLESWPWSGPPSVSSAHTQVQISDAVPYSPSGPAGLLFCNILPSKSCLGGNHLPAPGPTRALHGAPGRQTLCPSGCPSLLKRSRSGHFRFRACCQVILLKTEAGTGRRRPFATWACFGLKALQPLALKGPPRGGSDPRNRPKTLRF